MFCVCFQGSSSHPLNQEVRCESKYCGSQQLSRKQPMVRCLYKNLFLLSAIVFENKHMSCFVSFAASQWICVCPSRWATETKTSRKTSVSSLASYHFWTALFRYCIKSFSKMYCLTSLLCKAIKYTVEADKRRRISRVRFKNNTNIYTGSLSLPSSKQKCQTLKLFVMVRFSEKNTL